MRRDGKAAARGPIFQTAGKRALTRIEIERRDLVPAPQEPDCDLDGRRRLARSAFFVAENDDALGHGASRCRRNLRPSKSRLPVKERLIAMPARAARMPPRITQPSRST